MEKEKRERERRKRVVKKVKKKNQRPHNERKEKKKRALHLRRASARTEREKKHIRPSFVSFFEPRVITSLSLSIDKQSFFIEVLDRKTRKETFDTGSTTRRVRLGKRKEIRRRSHCFVFFFNLDLFSTPPPKKEAPCPRNSATSSTASSAETPPTDGSTEA